MKLTRAITHIPIRLDIKLDATNAGKLAQLDELAFAYMELCQAYTTAFCTTEEPDKFANPWIDSPLSARWQRAVIQHAAGIAQSWRTNRDRVYREYLKRSAWHAQQEISRHPAPVWNDWNTPVLKQIALQANANVTTLLLPNKPTAEQLSTEQIGLEQPGVEAIGLEPARGTTFDYWLRISTLEKGKPILIPITLAAYHRRALGSQRINTSMTLARKRSGWWLALTVDEVITPTTTDDSPVVGVDVGIANFLTTSDGKRYGTFQGKLSRRHQLDREKRQRKAKLRACLKKKGVERLPSVTNKRLGRHVRQEINRAVNQLYADYSGCQIAYEDLNVAEMCFHAKRMNAYLYASNLGHIPKQLAWGAQKRGQAARSVWAAYSSQCCSRCYYASKNNRQVQQTFCCQMCDFQGHADENAAINLRARFHDRELQRCPNKEEIKVLLDRRHKCRMNGCS